MTEEANPQPEYWLRLRDAFEAGEAVDAFDVHDAAAASMEKWERLCAESAEAQQRLLDYIAEAGQPLRSAVTSYEQIRVLFPAREPS